MNTANCGYSFSVEISSLFPVFKTKRDTMKLVVFLLFSILVTVKAQKDCVFYDEIAQQSLDGFLQKYWNHESKYLNDAYPSFIGKKTAYWLFALGFDSVLDGVERTKGRFYSHWIQIFYDAQKNSGWYSDYYDDENWMALAFLRASNMSQAFLNQGKLSIDCLNYVNLLQQDIRQNAWDTTCCGNNTGGLWWNKKHTQKATASNAGPVILFARLFELTQNEQYLDFALQVYEYWWNEMVLESGHVCDHINPDGYKECSWKFTYNEGLVIGASVELWRVTGEEKYLDNAAKVARYMIDNESVDSEYGKVLSDGDQNSCTGDCMEFKGPAYRYLKSFYEASSDKEILEFLESSVKSLWNNARDENDLFGVQWKGPPPSIADEFVYQSQQNAAVSALNVFGTLCHSL